jgi:hypothetical protein
MLLTPTTTTLVSAKNSLLRSTVFPGTAKCRHWDRTSFRCGGEAVVECHRHQVAARVSNLKLIGEVGRKKSRVSLDVVGLLRAGIRIPYALGDYP